MGRGGHALMRKSWYYDGWRCGKIGTERTIRTPRLLKVCCQIASYTSNEFRG